VWRLTALLDNILDLRSQRLVNELRQIDAANVVDESKVQCFQFQGAEVKAAQNTNVLELDDHLDLLELEKRVQVEVVVVEQALEGVEVEVVGLSELHQRLQFQVADDAHVTNIDAAELEVVELACREITGPALRGRGSRGNSREGEYDGRGELHLESGKDMVASIKIL
jgi:hypothetical protein